MRRLLTLLLICGIGSAAEKVEILRDEFGIPHIYSRTAAGAAFGSGYAQAADRLDQLLHNLHSTSTNSSPAALSPRGQPIVDAYCAGINSYLHEVNRTEEHVDAGMVEAFSRSAFGQSKDSNHVLISPARSTANAVIAIIDPHANWYGASRSYALQVSALDDGLAFSGAGPVGVPFPLEGHNGSISIAVTGEGLAGPSPLDQVLAMITAKNLDEAKKAIALHQLPSQKFLIGTADGDIYDSGAGVANPPAGVLVSGGGVPQAAAMTLELIGRAHNFSLESALSLALATDVYRAEAWQTRIAKVAPESEFARMITGWSRRADSNSRPALAFYLFKIALGDDSAALEPPDSLSDARIRAALRKAQDRLETEFPFDGVYGTVFRIARDGAQRSWPVGGGTLTAAGMATPRAIAFERKGSTLLGRGGQAAVQIVVLTRPPKSMMVLPLGQSDNPSSSHFDDQARELFSKSQAHPTYFGERKDLEKHSKDRKELTLP